ncbi:MAG: sigma 54-interacting transcriptional regulator [Deltaproteobacteria bacterium]
MSDETTRELRTVPASSLRPTVPALTILAHPDWRRVSAWTVLSPTTELARHTPTFDPTEEAPARPLDDPFVGRKPLLLSQGSEGCTIMRNGSTIRATVDGVELADRLFVDDARIDDGVVVMLNERIVLLLHRVQLPRAVDGKRLGMIGFSEAIERVRAEIEQVAGVEVPVLIRGESGVGKELVAQAIHAASARADRRLEAINMASIPPHLAASELFGHKKGAFTGAANDHQGCFLRADGGTLFLDEIGDTPQEVQPQLLRALETREILPIGGTAAQSVDVRVVSATDVALDDAIARQAFRGALLHRLAGFQIHVPPLRARREDIGPLLHAFLRDELTSLGAPHLAEDPDADHPWLPAPFVARLAAYAWPGNVRQLRNVARQLAIRGRGGRLEAAVDLDTLLPVPVQLAAPTVAAPASPPAPADGYRDTADIDDEELLAVLRNNAFRIAPSAVELNVSRASLYARIEATPRVRRAADLDANEITAALDTASGKLSQAAARLEVSVHALKLRMKALGLSTR